MLCVRGTSVRAIISMRYCALLKTRVPAWRKESLSSMTSSRSRTMSPAPLPVAIPVSSVRLMPPACRAVRYIRQYHRASRTRRRQAGQFAMHAARERQVVLREETEGVRVHDGEALRSQLVDAARREVFVEGQARIRQRAEAAADAVPEGVPGAATPDVLSAFPASNTMHWRTDCARCLCAVPVRPSHAYAIISPDNLRSSWHIQHDTHRRENCGGGPVNTYGLHSQGVQDMMSVIRL
jgi:hypothetical protein